MLQKYQLKKKTFCQPRKILHKVEEKDVLLLCNIKPECNVHHRQSTARLQKQKETAPFYIARQITTHSIHALKVNCK